MPWGKLSDQKDRAKNSGPLSLLLSSRLCVSAGESLASLVLQTKPQKWVEVPARLLL